MTRIILIIIMLYIGYKFVFHFLLPIIRVSKQMKDQVREFQSRMPQDHDRERTATTSERKKEGDYIDYEEVK